MSLAFFLRLAVLLAALFFSGILSIGCSVFSTGPEVSRAVIETAGGAAKSLIAHYQPEAMDIDVDGGISDPRYRAQVFVGSGVLVDILLSLEGIDLGAQIESTGQGVPLDREFARQATAIIGNDQLSRSEREKVLLELITGSLSDETTETREETVNRINERFGLNIDPDDLEPGDDGPADDVVAPE